MRLVFLINFFLMGFLLSACDNQSIIESDQRSLKNNDNQRQELIVWHTYSEEETRVFENELIPIFEKANPEIDIRPVRQSYSAQLKSALISRASSKKPPDIVRMDIAWIPKFIKLDLLHPLNQFERINDLNESIQEESRLAVIKNDSYYGLPLNTNTKVAIYNRELLNQAGYDTPPQTMDEIIKIATKFNYSIGMYGLAPWESLPYFYSFGGEFFDPTYSQTEGYLNSRESVDAFRKIIHLFKNETLNPNLLNGNSQTWQGVLNGTFFMIDEGPWFYSVNSEEERKKIEKLTVSAPFPVTNGRGSIIGGESLVMMKGVRDPNSAWKFMKWMAEKEAQQLMTKTGLIPANKNVDFTKIYEEYPYYQPYMEGIKNSFIRPPIAEWDRIENIYTHYFKLILAGNIEVETGLNKAANEIDQIMNMK